jgi:predicted thioesterase
VAVCYLEADDEITSAIARMRAVSDGEVIVVVPPGSRIATSRINFKLLAREAAERRLNAVAVTDDPATRALAIAAGLPAYDSVAAAEQALASFREQDRRLAQRLGQEPGEPSALKAPGQKTMTLPLPLPFDPAGPPAPQPAGPPVPSETAVMPALADARPRSRRTRRAPIAPIVALGLVALLLAAVAYGAYVFLPTATISVRPLTTELRPAPFSVTADPNVAVVDAAAGVIPAQLVTLPLHVEGEYQATGIEARETRASGVVRFRSENTLNAVPIPAQTVVSTAAGVEFVTQDAVTVPRASFDTGPSTIEVEVRAVRAGTEGNVAADQITRLPRALSTQLISVRNPDATSGGRRVEEALITQEDYDAAVADLADQLGATLTSELADEDSIPRGLVAFPETAVIGAAQPDQSATSLVDTVAPSFSLALDAEAQVVAVNEALIDEVAASRVRSQLSAGQALVGDRVAVTHDAGTVLGSTVVYEVTAQAQAYTQPNAQQIINAVRGKSLAEARQTLAQYGDADVTVWPDFIDRLPDQAARISVELLPPGTGS